MGRKKTVGELPRVFIRVNPKDKELLEEMSEEAGTTMSELCRHWLSDRATVERQKRDTTSALKVMEQFMTQLGEEMVRKGIDLDKIDKFIAGESERGGDLRRRGGVPRESKRPAKSNRSSNTGSKVPNLALIKPKRDSAR